MYSTPDNIFDNTLEDTQNWQGGLNAKEPVCPAAFVYFFMLLRVYALRCILLVCAGCFLLLVCAAAKACRCPVVCRCSQSCPVVMQSELCFYSLF